MEPEKMVRLHGIWASPYPKGVKAPRPYTKRVELALKVKSIPYEYIEEDLSNKSRWLHHYKVPVDKNALVLVHDGIAVTDSLVILEYIDEIWTDNPRLLPEDPYLKAKLRFWAQYLDPLLDNMRIIVVSTGEELAKEIDEILVKLDIIEKGINELLPVQLTLLNGQTPRYLDIVMFSILGSYAAAEEVIDMKIIDQERHPLLFKWLAALNEHPMVKEVSLPTTSMVERLRFVRQKFMKSTAA